MPTVLDGIANVGIGLHFLMGAVLVLAWPILLPWRPTNGLHTGLAGSSAATRSRQRMSLQGRPLPTADVGYPVAQVGSQLSGGEIARPTGVSRP
jgi:hypothetical protein